jgi:hypothetical protein
MLWVKLLELPTAMQMVRLSAPTKVPQSDLLWAMLWVQLLELPTVMQMVWLSAPTKVPRLDLLWAMWTVRLWVPLLVTQSGSLWVLPSDFPTEQTLVKLLALQMEMRSALRSAQPLVMLWVLCLEHSSVSASSRR